jgi:hypothetical protein
MSKWKDLLFEEEENALNPSPEQEVTIPTEVASGFVYGVPDINPINKDSPIGKFISLLTAYEQTLPDKDLRYKIAFTTLQAQGIDKQLIEKDIVATTANLNVAINQAAKTHQEKVGQINKLKDEEGRLNEQISALRTQIETASSVLDNDLKARNEQFAKYQNQIDDITVRLKGL